jgi:pimeloyl-ACP methyl ester carboxylesterase
MTISKMLHAASAAIAGFSIATALTIGAVAQTDSEQLAKNVVLVHGAWADGSSWDKVIPLLEAKGLHVVAVQLSLTSLDHDVATVKRALALQDGPTVLVGHSYAGAVISIAGNDDKVAGLVFASGADRNGTAAGPPGICERDAQGNHGGFCTGSFRTGEKAPGCHAGTDQFYLFQYEPPGRRRPEDETRLVCRCRR